MTTRPTGIPEEEFEVDMWRTISSSTSESIKCKDRTFPINFIASTIRENVLKLKGNITH